MSAPGKTGAADEEKADTLLSGRSVLITGVGPDLGRAIALRTARAGADVVVAARTAARLEKIAEEVAGLGRRAVPVAADISKPEDAERMVATALDAFGRVDTVVHNAFAMPPMEPLADTTLETIKTSFDVNVLSVIRLTRLLTPTLASSPGGGSIVMTNSAVLRHSRVGYAGYKMAKSALLSLAQSLATELGPSGIRVNSVAPGWIWGSTLQWYFGYLAEQRGVSRDDVYAETAALTDLRRLPEPDEIADTVVFLASPMARAITGQCLDVNCGEFHHLPGDPCMTDIGTADELMESAAKLTGLSDFTGPSNTDGDEFREGLEVLVASYASDESLTPAGVKAARAQIRGALMARLASQAAWDANPAHASVPISRPIVVTGLPRSGTTALHRLLVSDPAHQGLELWLSQVPQPRPPRATWSQDPMFQMIASSIARHSVSRPEFLGVHELGADQVEECWQLLRQSFRSVSFECLAHLPAYSSWLDSQDWVPAYRRHKRNLQLIGLPDASQRWVLKNPSHLFALDALLTVYPDALVIVTHRSPRTAIASACSLAEQASSGWSSTFRGSVIGADQLSLWARGIQTFTAARARHDQARFYDVQYSDFVADPLGTVASVYAHFGLTLTPEAADAMRAVVAESAGSSGQRASHRYSLADFGLTDSQVDQRFATV